MKPITYRGSCGFIKMNQNKLFGFTFSEHGTTYSGLYAVKNTLRADKCMKYFSGTQSKEVSLRF